MDVHEEGTVTGSIDVAKLDQIEPKSDEARAQLDALKAQVAEGQQQASDDADRVAEQAEAQSPEGLAEVEGTTTEAGAFGNETGDGFASDPAAAGQPDEADDLEALRAEAEGLGVKVDRRWGAERLRSEIDAARAV